MVTRVLCQQHHSLSLRFSGSCNSRLLTVFGPKTTQFRDWTWMGHRASHWLEGTGWRLPEGHAGVGVAHEGQVDAQRHAFLHIRQRLLSGKQGCEASPPLSLVLADMPPPFILLYSLGLGALGPDGIWKLAVPAQGD